MDAAPPPNFIDDARDFSGAGIASVHFSRATGRDLDLTHLLATRKLIIMGYMPESSPLPLPLTVDGETPRSNGWTTVRFILPVEEE